MSSAYAYVLFDFTGTPFYVGVGTTKDRDLQHEKRSDPFNWLKDQCIERTWKVLGEIPKIRIYFRTRREALDSEIALIAAIGRIDLETGSLTNLTAGGDGADSETMKRRYARMAPGEWSLVTKQRDARMTPEARSERTRRGWIGNDDRRIRLSEQRRLIKPDGKKISEGILSKNTPEQRRERSRKANQVSALRTPEQRKLAALKGTPEERSERCRRREANFGPEYRSERTRKMWANKTPEQRSDIVRRSNATRAKLKALKEQNVT